MITRSSSGFTLIELMIAIVISSMLAVALFTTLNSSLRSAQSIDSMSSVDQAMMVLYQRMEADIFGMTVPMHGDPTQKPQTPKAKQEKLEEQQPIDKEKKDKKGSKKQQEELLERYLVVQHEGERLKEFSCITNNPFVFYDQQLPRLVRVTYRLEKNTTGRYVLQRGQSIELEEKAVTTFFDVCTNLISLHMYMTFVLDKQADEQTSQEKKQQEYKKIEEFPLANNEQIDKPLPATVTIKGDYWDEVSKKEFPFSYSWVVPTWQAPIKNSVYKREGQQQKAQDEPDKQSQKGAS